MTHHENRSPEGSDRRAPHPLSRIALASFVRLGKTFVDLCLPEPCVICGGEIRPGSRNYPLCAPCERSMGAARGGRLCSLCGRPLVSEILTCVRCREAGFPFKETFSLSLYEGDDASVLRAYKLAGHRRLRNYYAERLSGLLAGRRAADCVVPVPFAREKLRKKGWDQIDDIVRILARRGFSVANLLVRRAGAEQKTLGRPARGKNAEASFALAPGARVPERCVLLDDVMTTGATAKRCAELLLGGGAKEVTLVVVASD